MSLQKEEEFFKGLMVEKLDGERHQQRDGSMYHTSRTKRRSACARVDAMAYPRYALALFSTAAAVSGAGGAVCARVSASTRARGRVSRSG